MSLKPCSDPPSSAGGALFPGIWGFKALRLGPVRPANPLGSRRSCALASENAGLACRPSCPNLRTDALRAHCGPRGGMDHWTIVYQSS